jgi:hypothetical protein
MTLPIHGPHHARLYWLWDAWSPHIRHIIWFFNLDGWIFLLSGYLFGQYIRGVDILLNWCELWVWSMMGQSKKQNH